MKKSIAIFGSTGSIGTQTVELVERDLDQYNVEVITTNSNSKLIVEQAKRLHAKRIVIVNGQYHQNLRGILNIEVLFGYDALIECAKIPVDISVMAITGIAGLGPTMEGIKHAKIVAIANKESLVCAGAIINSMLNKAQIIPIDSEHNAIFQIYNEKIDSITLTASGGAFYQNKVAVKTIEKATMHPVWSMGKKISVDSATMMNKVLEVIVAHYLFKIDINKINIIIHPEAIIHGILSYVDGNNIAVLSQPNMKIPIAYALNWPERKKSSLKLALTQIASMNFYEPDYTQFPALNFLQTDNYVLLNAANEIAVNSFLEGMISFDEIVLIIGKVISSCEHYKPKSVQEILDYDSEVRQITKEKILYK